jgi:hypothetical protein
LTQELLLEIARCPELALVDDAAHPCREIVTSQGRPPASRQVPEPWTGHLGTAPILFLTQNPSLSWQEQFPRQDWADDRVEDFFENRFSGGTSEWARENRALSVGGDYPGRPIQLWSFAAGRAAEILDREAVPGEDFVLSQVVHCKMEGDGTDERTSVVAAALGHCADRYLIRMLEASAASVVVVLGKLARDSVARSCGVLASPSNDVDGPLRIAGRQRVFVWLPLPSYRGRGKKNLPDRLIESQMRTLRPAVAR